VSFDHATTYRPEAAADLTVHTYGPFVPLLSLRVQLDLCRPVTIFVSPQCVTELHETFRTSCQRICWGRVNCGLCGAVPYCHGDRPVVITKRINTMLASSKDLP